MSPGRWHRPLSLAAVLLLVAGLAAPARAAYGSTVAINDTAFDPVCLGFEDGFPEKMKAAAKAAFVRLGHAVTLQEGAGFTRAKYLSAIADDWSTYVHSHGDFYWHTGDQRRYSGFREDSGDCSQAIIYSKDIATKRAGRQSNLVFMSTCHNGEAATTMPGAFAIPKRKALPGDWAGPNFYVGYLGDAWDSDEWKFEQKFWDTLGPGLGTGFAFDTAANQVFAHDLEANWYGSYAWNGRGGPLPDCPNCL